MSFSNEEDLVTEPSFIFVGSPADSDTTNLCHSFDTPASTPRMNATSPFDMEGLSPAACEADRRRQHEGKSVQQDEIGTIAHLTSPETYPSLTFPDGTSYLYKSEPLSKRSRFVWPIETDTSFQPPKSPYHSIRPSATFLAHAEAFKRSPLRTFSTQRPNLISRLGLWKNTDKRTRQYDYATGRHAGLSTHRRSTSDFVTDVSSTPGSVNYPMMDANEVVNLSSSVPNRTAISFDLPEYLRDFASIDTRLPARHSAATGRRNAFSFDNLLDALPQLSPVQAPIDRLQQHHPRCFLPMSAVGNPHHRSQTFVSSNADTSEAELGFSPRYYGMHTQGNASVEHLPDNQNCALWLTNLPADITHHTLLASIRNIGRIWCCYINLPDYAAHYTAAAKVVFFQPESAMKLLSLSWTSGLVIGGNRVKVAHNRIKYAAHSTDGNVSRVLVITGSADFVNEASLTKFFKDRFIFQLDEAYELMTAGGRRAMEYRFGSYRCQAQMGKMALEKDRPIGLEKVEYGDDPCEMGETYTSYSIGAERIRGRGI